jgi:hypothetical protein
MRVVPIGFYSRLSATRLGSRNELCKPSGRRNRCDGPFSFIPFPAHRHSVVAAHRQFTAERDNNNGLGAMTTTKPRPPLAPGETRAYPVLRLRDIVVFPHIVRVGPFARGELRTLKRVRAETAGTTEGPALCDGAPSNLTLRLHVVHVKDSVRNGTHAIFGRMTRHESAHRSLRSYGAVAVSPLFSKSMGVEILGFDAERGPMRSPASQ